MCEPQLRVSSVPMEVIARSYSRSGSRAPTALPATPPAPEASATHLPMKVTQQLNQFRRADRKDTTSSRAAAELMAAAAAAATAACDPGKEAESVERRQTASSSTATAPAPRRHEQPTRSQKLREQAMEALRDIGTAPQPKPSEAPPPKPSEAPPPKLSEAPLSPKNGLPPIQPRSIEDFIQKDLEDFWKWCPTPVDGLHRVCLLVKLFDYTGLTKKADKVRAKVLQLDTMLRALLVMESDLWEPNQRVQYETFVHNGSLKRSIAANKAVKNLWESRRRGMRAQRGSGQGHQSSPASPTASTSLKHNGDLTPLKLWVVTVINSADAEEAPRQVAT